MKKIFYIITIMATAVLIAIGCSNPQVATTQATNIAVPAVPIPSLYPNPLRSTVRSVAINQHNYPYLNHNGVFAESIVPLGDIDGNGPAAYAVAVTVFDDAQDPQAIREGSVYILFLNIDGTLLSHRRIDRHTANVTGPFARKNNNIGLSIASLGDLDGAGPAVTTIAVGSTWWKGSEGGVQLLYLLPDGSVLRSVTIDSATANGPTDLHTDIQFGRSLAHIGDLDGAGAAETVLAVGTSYIDHPVLAEDYDNPTGAVYLIYLLPDGSVLKTVKLSKNIPRFPAGYPHPFDSFGTALAWLPHAHHPDDVSRGVLAIGVKKRRFNEPPNTDEGEVALIRLLPDGSVLSFTRINGNTNGVKEYHNNFGENLVNIHPFVFENTHPGAAYGLGVSHFQYVLTSELGYGFYNWQYLFLAEDLSVLASHDVRGDIPNNFDGNIARSRFQSGSAYIGVLDPTKPYEHALATHVELVDSMKKLDKSDVQTLFLHIIDTRWDR